MKIIIVGCGKVGCTIAEQLDQEGHNITLVDTNPDILEKDRMISIYTTIHKQ